MEPGFLKLRYESRSFHLFPPPIMDLQSVCVPDTSGTSWREDWTAAIRRLLDVKLPFALFSVFHLIFIQKEGFIGVKHLGWAAEGMGGGGGAWGQDGPVCLRDPLIESCFLSGETAAFILWY